MQRIAPGMATKAWIRTSLSIVALVGAVFAYYYYTWNNIQDFVDAIDHCELLFCDFKQFFWIAGRDYFVSPAAPVAGFVYSAFSGLLFVPLGFLSEDLASVLWGAVQIGLLIPLWRMSPWSSLRIFYLFLIITSFPVIHNFKWGQVSLLLTVCILGTYVLHQKGRCRSAACVLAVAAAIKYYPALFAVYFMAKKDWRSTRIFCIAFAIMFFVLPICLLGYENWFSFQHITLLDAIHNVGPGPDSQYMPNVMMRLFPALEDDNAQDILNTVSTCIAGFNIALVVLLQMRNTRYTDALTISLICVTLPFLLRTSWPHYFIYLPFCQMAVFAEIYAWEALSLRWKMPFYIGVCVSMLLSSIFAFNYFPEWGSYNDVGVLFWSNSAVLLMIYAIMVLRGERRQMAG